MDTNIKLRRKITWFNKDAVKFEARGIEIGKILFYGDSHFTCWSSEEGVRDLEDDIRMKDGSKAAINHGFGGATFEELLYFYPRLVRPWKPRALVLSSHGNDFGENYTPEEMMFLLSRIFEYARQDMPGIKLYACDAHPNPKGAGEKDEKYYSRIEFNKRLKEYCEEHEDCTFICNARCPMFYNDPENIKEYANIRSDLYRDDMLHHNQKGYDLYAEFIREALDDIL